MSGLILIDRSMLDHHIVGIKNPLRFSAWCWMLTKARYKAGTYFHNGHEISLEIGQFACARSHMSKETGLTDKQVRVFLSALERSNMVTKAVHDKGQGISIISIVKYAEYQDFSKYREMKGPSKGPVKGQGGASLGPHSETPEETPEETPVVGGANAPSTKRGSRLPSDWFLPKEYGDWALSEGYSRDQVLEEAAIFKDHWLGKSGKDASKMDWKAVWRNWMRKSKKMNGGQNGKSYFNGDSDTSSIVQRNNDAAAIAIARKTGGSPT